MLTANPLLIRNAAIVAVDPEVGELPRADILVLDGEIAQIGTDLDAPPAEVIDADSMIAIPGLVDGHRHLWEGLLRNCLPDGDIVDYLSVVNGQFAPAHTPEDAYLGELVTALGALDAGVTTVLDWSHIQTSPAHTDAVVAALRRSGIRARLAYGPPGAEDGPHGWPQDVSRVRDETIGHDDLIALALATFSPEHQPYEVAEQHFSVARAAGVPVSVHAGLRGMGEPGQIERFGRAGLLGPDVNLVHCNTLSAEEWRIVADTGTTVSLTASTEMQMGQGVPPLRQAMRVGVLPSIGVDVEVSSATDLWTQMRILFSLQRSQVHESRYADPESNAEAEPPVSTAQILRCATQAGADACLLGDRVGSLTVGKQADIVLLRTDMVHTFPVTDLTSAVVHTMDARNVHTVLVGGRVVKRHGALVDVDVAQLAKQVEEARDRVFTAAGVPFSQR